MSISWFKIDTVSDVESLQSIHTLEMSNGIINKLEIPSSIGLFLSYLEYKHWILVNWTVTENQSSAIMTHIANKIATVTQHMNHEIPIGIGVLGFMPGLVLGLYKG